MGGDHRCPVCQATFTRPQHVARHMRSHTGDRPYKCLYCGDQFARSDLLSRHCNKCHANEKPLAAAGARRRGSASASRATTSKQACDQCVQSSLPCDGANPCTKCVQRKCRCTYVKFHRQTAPVGPGHNTRPAHMGPAGANPPVAPHPDSHMSMYAHADDQLLLGTHPTVVPSMADNIYSQPFNFPPIYEHSADPSLTLADNPDLAVAAKYRTQPDPYRRSSMPLSSSTAPGAGLIPGLYTDPRQQPPSNWMAWGQENDPSFTSTTTNHPEGIHVDKNLHAYMGTQGVSTYPHPNAYIDQRDRRGSSSDYASEGSSATSQSIPSSAASSSVHLPMEGMGLHQHYPSDQHPFGAPPDRAYANRGQEGGFSSAFGLMSLDDPNALVGISNDGAPFFSNEALNALGSDDPNQTPVPAQTESKQRRGSTAQTPSKEAEIRELREFWKQYIRTPLSGSSLMCSGNDGSSPQTQRQAAPSPFSYRRPRVSSMPSTKSPLSVDLERHPQNRDDMSSIRTTLAAQDDLKSYEAAVLARKAPTTLRIGPRARRKTGGPDGSPQVPSIHEEQKVINLNYSPTSSRPPSAMGVPALPSLANFTGKLLPVHLAYPQDKVSKSSPPSRESSISVDDSAGSGGSDREGLRPSFKRLPSQALGPPNSKRAQLSPKETGLGRPDSASSSGIPVPVYANRASDCGGGVDFDGGNVHSRPSSSVPDRPAIIVPGNMFVDHGRPLTGVPQHTFQHPDRTVVNISERHRRMSAPTMTAPSLPAFTFVAPPGPGPGANP